MKAVAINGSPRPGGNTEILLKQALAPLAAAGWETEFIQLGGEPIRGCQACYRCVKKKNARCAREDDFFNSCFEKMVAADAIILGSPTYFTDVSAEMKALRESEQRAIELLQLKQDSPRRAEMKSDPLVAYVLMDAEANVLCPATKLWNTGHGANMMREAVSLMGGYGITEDCPGFLASKWMDAQLEATYEGPEAVQRRQLTVTMASEVFLALFRTWTAEMRKIASTRPGTGACTLASAMQLWQWTMNHLQKATDADGDKLYHGQRQGVTFPLADALCWLMASRAQILDVLELENRGAEDAVVAEGLDGTVQFLSDLCHTQAAQAAGEVGRICAELVFGYNRHPAWNEEGHAGCFLSSELDDYEETMPGISAYAVDVLAADGSHPQKAGPCASCMGGGEFLRLQNKLSTCLSGSRLAKDRAAETVSKVMIPEALDYPA